ncbi:MAG: NAD(P)/FAD-dependent oxidoreductase [Casimicrobium sp.]
MNRGEPNIAVVGAGIAGATCARALADAGLAVTLFDKSRGVGGRLATRRVEFDADDGTKHTARLDHGAPAFDVTRSEFAAFVQQAERSGLLARWTPRVKGTSPTYKKLPIWVPTPDVPNLCRALSAGLPLHTGSAVDALRHDVDGWSLGSAGFAVAGGFSHVVLAIPPRQASDLLRTHNSSYAERAANVAMLPCWTMMAITDELVPLVDWEIAHPERGPIAQIIRNDMKPGRERTAGLAQWVAHATSQWSQAHLEMNPDDVSSALQLAFEDWHGGSLRWRHAIAHRWRYALPLASAESAELFWWDDSSQIGICGDAIGGRGVEDAWRSAMALADFLINNADGSQARRPVASPLLAQTSSI